MMDRRSFIASTAAVSAVGLAGTAVAKERKGASDVHPDLTGIWVDPFLMQPATIIIESNRSGSNVRVTGSYWHKESGQSTFHGTGTLKGNQLSISYDHSHIDGLGKGAANLTLSKVENVLVLKGSIKKSDGSWSASNVSWFKKRR